MTSIGSWVSLAFVFVLAAQSPAAAAQLASKEDAVVSSTDTGWVLTNALVTYAIGFDANGDLVLQDLRRTGDTLSWRPSPGPRHGVPHRGSRDRPDAQQRGRLPPRRRRSGRYRHRPRAAPDLRGFARRPPRPARLRDSSPGRPRRGVDRARVHQRPVHDRERSRSRSSWSSTARWPRPSTVSRGRRRAAGRSRSSTTSCPRTRRSSSRSADARRSATCRSCRWRRRAARSSSGLMWSGAWRMDLVGKPGGRTELTAWLSSTTTTRDADARR